jgi:hypothetical protein
LVFICYKCEHFNLSLQLAGDGDKSARDASVLALSSVMFVVGENIVKSNAPTIASDKEKWDKVRVCALFYILFCFYRLLNNVKR